MEGWLRRQERLFFRAETVGSLLRPQPLIKARERRKRGEIDAPDLRRIEDGATAAAVQ